MTEHGNGNGESPPEDWAESIPPEWGEPVSFGGRGMPEPEVEPSPDYSDQHRSAQYVYESRDGEPLRRKVRLEPGLKGKAASVAWERPDGDGWRRCEKEEGEGNPGVLYALPLLVDAEVVHLGEGEKAADALNAYFAEHSMADCAATCAPTTAWNDDFTETLRGKRVVLWADRDPVGEKQAAKVFLALRMAGSAVATVRARVSTEKANAADHLEAGFDPDQGEPFTVPISPEQRDEIEYVSRFADDRTSIAYVFDTPPKPREFLLRDFLPGRESGFIIATGGSGKGHFEIALTLALATGQAFGRFATPRPRGVVIVSVEDDHEEMHRRLAAAMESRFQDEIGEPTCDWRTELRDLIVRRVRSVDLRGVTGAFLGPTMRDRIARVARLVEDPGLVLIDPLGRLVPPGVEINSQEGGGTIVNEMDALRDATGCTVLTSHHVNKAAIRDGRELAAGAASGSHLITDLARWVLNLKSLTRKEPGEYGLPHPGSYVEAAVTKTNYTPPLSEPLVFRRSLGGVLIPVQAQSKTDVDDQHALAALLKAGDWLTRDAWDEASKELADIGVNRIRAARSRLSREGKVEAVELRDGRRFKAFFAPAANLRPMAWPPPPATLAEGEAGRT